MIHVATERLVLGISTVAAAMLQGEQLMEGIPGISWAAVALFGGGLVAWGTLRQRAARTESDLDVHKRENVETFAVVNDKLDALHQTVTDFRIEMERRLPRPPHN